MFISQTDENIRAFLAFLDYQEIPTLKLDDDEGKRRLLELLDIAGKCMLKNSTIPGYYFLCDLIYEQIDNLYGIKIDYLMHAAERLYMELYSYDMCKLALYKWGTFKIYEIFPRSKLNEIPLREMVSRM